jgi:hypothetical protein
MSAGPEMPEADEEPAMQIRITDGPGNMPLGRCLQEQADAERAFGGQDQEENGI